MSQSVINTSPKKRSFIDRLAFNYFIKMVKEQSGNAEDDFHILNENEVKSIHQIRRWALGWSAILGVLGVVVLYIPLYAWPTLFPKTTIHFPWIGTQKVPIIFTIYSTILVVIELYYLTIVNLQAVHKMAKVCGFPQKDDPDYEKHLEGLYSIGMERESTEMQKYGINPLAGINKYYLMLVLILNRLKGTITNLLVKLVFKRLLGRIVLRVYIDLLGMPVYAFWNALAAHKVLREAKVRIMAPNLINQLTNNLYEDLEHDEEFKDFLYDALQLIAVVKRTFHHNHYLLVEKLITKFDIPIKEEQAEMLKKDALLEKVKGINGEAREGIAKLCIFGMMIDGSLSRKERDLLDELQNLGLIEYEWQTLKKWEQSFVNGQGLDEFFGQQLLKQ
ncbi:hypothetical protein BKI52_06900 [marine bacterium AO1-C]|nr:hypothetical protein BKI52_06900 [marine bacterium AO1-C]